MRVPEWLDRIAYWFLVIGGILTLAQGLMTSDLGSAAFGLVCFLYAEKFDTKKRQS